MEPKPTIYVVEDDPAVTFALSLLIRAMGMATEVYYSAEAFLDAYEPGSRQCLILDIRLSGMSGLELQKVMAKRDSRLPIVFITGHADTDISAEVMKQGGFAFLEKPFHSKELTDCIRKAVAAG